MKIVRHEEAKVNNQNQPGVSAVKIFLTVKQFAEKHQAFTQNSLRWMIFNRSTNGFDWCFKKVGEKRILIDEAAFFEKVDGSKMES
jgi:hypothetical protein